ncbi:MalM family protein [Vibrio astriarenae]
MNVKTLLMAALSIALTGCSTAPEPHELMTTSVSCCKDIHSVNKTTLTVPFHQEVILNSQTQHIPLSMLNKTSATNTDALVPVVVYELPSSLQNPQSDMFSILLRSYVEHDQVFAAKMIFMDSNWQIINQFSVEEFDYHSTSLKGLERVEQVITLSSNNLNARFMVVTTDTELFGHTLTRKHPEEVYAEQNNIIGQKHLPLTAQYSNTGRVDITTSKFSNSALLSMLAEFTGTKTQDADKAPTSTNDVNKPWTHYQAHIDQALANGDISEAANMTQEAGEAGHTQAKDYLLQQLAE